MIVVYYILAALLIYMSHKSYRGGVQYLNYFRQSLAEPRSLYTPPATVFAPCKGCDPDLKSNLSAIFDQDYTEFEIVFVTESADDPAAAVIKQLISGNSRPAKLVIARRAADSSQKVENLREAVLHVSKLSQVFAFVDSDTRPANDWLRSLVAPLEQKSVGASTGYRWFLSDRRNFGSEMRSVWNASIASALGRDTRTNFCWGGSMAISRETFDRLEMRERWRGTLSDDFAVTRAVREAGLEIRFVPKALTASVGDCTLRETVEFTNRQMKITRTYSPNLWLLSFFGSGVFNAVMLASLLIVALSSRNDIHVLLAALTFLAVSAFSIGKSVLRLRAVGLVLGRDWPQVRKQWFTQNTLWSISPALFFVNCVAATVSRRLTWRGIRYELKSPTETVIIGD